MPANWANAIAGDIKRAVGKSVFINFLIPLEVNAYNSHNNKIPVLYIYRTSNGIHITYYNLLRQLWNTKWLSEAEFTIKEA